MRTQNKKCKFSFAKLLLLSTAALFLLCALWGCEQAPVQTQSSTAATTLDPVWEEKSQLVTQYMDDGDFVQANAVIAELKQLGYAEAEELFQQAHYLWAQALAEAGDHVSAYEKLKKIPGYADADQLLEQQTQAIYAEGQALYREGNYYEAEKRFLRVSTYADAKKYIALINVRNYPLSESVIEGLLTIFYFEDASEVLLSTHPLAELFLKGLWGDSHGYYFIIDEKGYDIHLPQIPDNQYLAIEDGVFYFYPDRNAEPVPMLDVTVVTPDCLSIYNRMDQKTYTLLRMELPEGPLDKPYEI